MRHEEVLSRPIFKKRQAVISRIPHFWPLVFEQAPLELDPFIQPTDSRIFAESLRSFEISRFEVGEDGTVAPGGSPRSLLIRFGFGPNEWFEDDVLEKKFWFRKGSDSWNGLVSEPVRIRWKQGKDLTDGLTDQAWELFEERRKRLGSPDEKSAAKKLPQWTTLAENVESHFDGELSFFAWFAFVAERRYVTAEESVAATATEIERMERRKKGEKAEEPASDDGGEADEGVEVFVHGEEVATLLAEDVWPHAISYFSKSTMGETRRRRVADNLFPIAQGQEADDETMSEMDFQEEGESDEDEELDIRSLVKDRGKRKATGGDIETPAKKK